MKRLLSLALVGLFTAGMVGCRASGEVDGPDDDNDMNHRDNDRDGDRSMKKTTTYDDDGNTVKKETSIDRD